MVGKSVLALVPNAGPGTTIKPGPVIGRREDKAMWIMFSTDFLLQLCITKAVKSRKIISTPVQVVRLQNCSYFLEIPLEFILLTMVLNYGINWYGPDKST